MGGRRKRARRGKHRTRAGGDGNSRKPAGSLQSHREETQWRGAGGSAQREMRGVRDDRASARDPRDAAPGQRGIVSLRDVHADHLLHRAERFVRAGCCVGFPGRHCRGAFARELRKRVMRGPKTAPPGSARLFHESHPTAPPAGVHIANIDGASRGNPGPAAYAVVMRDPEGKLVLELAKKFGRDTNNVAEYYALLAALDYATTHSIAALRVRCDSELLVRQMQGRYKVKSADLKPLHERASILTRQLKYFTIEHVRREQNRDADALANVALDSGPVNSASPEAKRGEPRAAAERRPAARPHHFRARYVNGVLVPTVPLDLPEGTEVLLDLRISPKD